MTLAGAMSRHERRTLAAARASQRATRRCQAEVGARARKPDARATASSAAADLLAWYDRHRRDLPWRAAAGETPDPYRVWLSEIMLQQTTVTAVGAVFRAFHRALADVRGAGRGAAR